ncbi:B12-binding domain-containing radical SAM protein [Syntrophothermus lipocalidus]|uniref:Radical SAM domain protein n=1 Tax=Syntrophothermus lipocalidus (strain DSM 12680 / TGB-C1) TaxID=643648 RepID=D7CMD6_SYNLT|nr:B12-binding domain-containing radical SAM protein [Syntrophothermus lipocalidus]ADI01871.1 Radical SAM domain protein [Syntrophothermus lipocalidus DSM 12680]
MKVLLVALNAKFVHTNLAVRYLKSYCESDFPDIVVREFTINEYLPDIMAEIYREKPDIIGFSCYIWNIEGVFRLTRDLKQVLPGCVVILGGPEVSFDSVDLLEAHPFIDGIVRGEGEETFLELLRSLDNRGSGLVKGVTWREGNRVIYSEDRNPITRLDSIPFPYEKETENLNGRIVYYETSRGCPFNCSYCISSTTRGVRWFTLERVKEDLRKLLQIKPKEIKFVDRTFNANPKRMREIMDFLIQEAKETSCHFEIAADRLDQGTIEFLKSVPLGVFRFEIGVQSTNPEVLQAVNRPMNWELLESNVKSIRQQHNIFIHLDLIAGLPGETYHSVANSFNQVYRLCPDHLQLGFLKMLKGSAIRDKSYEHGYKFSFEPPYEVLQNAYITYGEMVRLKRIEDLVEKYYNSGDFAHSLRYMIKHGWKDDAFRFYEEFAGYWEDKRWHRVHHNKSSLYSMLMQFVSQRRPDLIRPVNELLKFDYLLNYHSQKLPDGLTRIELPGQKEFFDDFLRQENNRLRYFSTMQDVALGKLKRQLHLEVFTEDVLFLGELRERELSGPYFLVLFRKGDNACDLGQLSVYGFPDRIC